MWVTWPACDQKPADSFSGRVAATSMSRPNNPISAGLGSVSAVLALGGLLVSGVLLQWYTGADTQKFGAPVVVSLLSCCLCP